MKPHSLPFGKWGRFLSPALKLPVWVQPMAGIFQLRLCSFFYRLSLYLHLLRGRLALLGSAFKVLHKKCGLWGVLFCKKEGVGRVWGSSPKGGKWKAFKLHFWREQGFQIPEVPWKRKGMGKGMGSFHSPRFVWSLILSLPFLGSGQEEEKGKDRARRRGRGIPAGDRGGDPASCFLVLPLLSCDDGMKNQILQAPGNQREISGKCAGVGSSGVEESWGTQIARATNSYTVFWISQKGRGEREGSLVRPQPPAPRLPRGEKPMTILMFPRHQLPVTSIQWIHEEWKMDREERGESGEAERENRGNHLQTWKR